MTESGGSKMRCGICEREFDPATSVAMPFCSVRCKQIDLRRWMVEDYAVPHVPRPDDDEELAEPKDE